MALCRDGKRAYRLVVERRGSKAYIYGLYYERGRTRRCYVGPADPGAASRQLAAGLLLDPGAWSSAVAEAAREAMAESLRLGGPGRASEIMEGLLRSLTGVAQEYVELLRRRLGDVYAAVG